MPSNPIGYERTSTSVEHFWNSKDNIILSPEWSNPESGMKIFVTCDDDDDATTEAGDELDNNLENLCLAVTEQALS